jgi:serine/threonine protein kinase
MIELKRKNIAHRDIKLNNLFLNIEKNGEHVYKIADFGLSKSYESEALKSLVGSDYCWHPKVMSDYIRTRYRKKNRKHKTFEPAIDLWTIGIALYHFITATYAFSQDLFRTNITQPKQRQML